MTAVKQPNQELFDYLSNELNVIALLTQMHEIAAIVMSKHKQQIKDAYNQGYREGLDDANIIECIPDAKDVAECSNAEDYFNENF